MFKNNLRQHLEQTFSNQELKRWYDPLGLHVCEQSRQLDVRFPHAFFSTWFAENMQGRFEEQLGIFLGPGYVIRYGQGNGCHAPREAGNDSHMAPPAMASVMSGATRIDFPFDSQYTFERFLVNKKNYFPLASAKEVSKQRNILFNPFVICGESGSGKTHLLRAIGNEISKTPDAGSIFLGSIEDISHLFFSNGNGDVHKAREQLCAHHAMLVDDFHLIRNHPDLQNEFIVLFNHFYEQKKQMIVVCSERINTYEFLDPTLKSRLEWGLIVTLKKPDFDIRVKYIRNQCRQKKMKLDKEQEITLAQRFNDFRSLQGILIKFFAYSKLLNRDIGPKDFEHILSHAESTPQPVVTPEGVMQTVADHFEVDPAELRGARRLKHIVRARQISMYLIRKLMGISFPELGRIFGGKDHSTVLYAVNKIDELQRVNKDMKQLLITLKEKCRSMEESM